MVCCIESPSLLILTAVLNCFNVKTGTSLRALCLELFGSVGRRHSRNNKKHFEVASRFKMLLIPLPKVKQLKFTFDNEVNEILNREATENQIFITLAVFRRNV